jgi:D-alanyl-D-alanine dipeptidase
MKFYHQKIALILFLLGLNLMFSPAESDGAIPDSCHQLIVVLTDIETATTGTLQRFERASGESEWIKIGEQINVALGRKGLGWGRGLHKESAPQGFPMKREGDGKSPAGVFKLSAVFGYSPESEMADLKMPYIHISELIECIDDKNSQHYNQIVSRDKIQNVDWKSSERMSRYGIHYAQGVVVDHNVEDTVNGAGSCIFLHNWSKPGEPTSGCTAMEPENLSEIAFWLDVEKQPVFVQITKQQYKVFTESWTLPVRN